MKPEIFGVLPCITSLQRRIWCCVFNQGVCKGDGGCPLGVTFFFFFCFNHLIFSLWVQKKAHASTRYGFKKPLGPSSPTYLAPKKNKNKTNAKPYNERNPTGQK